MVSRPGRASLGCNGMSSAARTRQAVTRHGSGDHRSVGSAVSLTVKNQRSLNGDLSAKTRRR